MLARAAQTYQRVDLESAPKIQIVDRLFCRFQDDVIRARSALVVGDVRRKAVAIDHALQIVAEFSAALDHAAAPALCANLSALYDFVRDQLTVASVSRDPSALDRADRVMAEIGGAFRRLHEAGVR